MTRRKFSREFKVEAVKLVTERGVAVAQAVRDLDVAESVLRRWMRGTDEVTGALFSYVNLEERIPARQPQSQKPVTARVSRSLRWDACWRSTAAPSRGSRLQSAQHRIGYRHTDRGYFYLPSRCAF